MQNILYTCKEPISTPTKPFIFTKLSGSYKKTFGMLNHCICVQNYVCAFNYIVCTQNIWCVHEIVLYACKTILFYEHTKCAYARKWFSTRNKSIVYKIYAYKSFVLVTNTLYSKKICCTCTNYMYANKIGLYMYTSCDENAGFAQQKSTTDPVKCSTHMNYVCFKVFRWNAFISYMCLSKFSSFFIPPPD